MILGAAYPHIVRQLDSEEVVASIDAENSAETVLEIVLCESVPDPAVDGFQNQSMLTLRAGSRLTLSISNQVRQKTLETHMQ